MSLTRHSWSQIFWMPPQYRHSPRHLLSSSSSGWRIPQSPQYLNRLRPSRWIRDNCSGEMSNPPKLSFFFLSFVILGIWSSIRSGVNENQKGFLVYWLKYLSKGHPIKKIHITCIHLKNLEKIALSAKFCMVAQIRDRNISLVTMCCNVNCALFLPWYLFTSMISN